MKATKDAAFRFLARKRDWVLTSDVARAVGVSRVTIVQHLKELLGQGLVERRRIGRAGMWRMKQSGSAESSAVLTLRSNETTRQLYAERDAYLRMRTKLLADPRYAGKFVSVLRAEVVDADSDERELVRRVYGKYGYVVVYVEKVQEEKRIPEIPSPERTR